MNLKTIRGFSEFESHELVFGVIKFIFVVIGICLCKIANV